MIDYKTDIPHKFDELTQRFIRVGTRQAEEIYAGLKGHAVIRSRGYANNIYGWVETEKKWKILDQSKLSWIGIGESGRLFKIDYDSDKVFQ